MPTPHIPLELHHHILAYTPSVPASAHLPWLWRTCRRTSRLVRAAAERVFVERHLRHPRTVVRFPLGEGAVAEGGDGEGRVTVYGLEVVLRFVGFEEEGEEDERDGGGGGGEGGEGARERRRGGDGAWMSRRAIFRDVRPEACFGVGVLDVTKARWREAVEGWSVGGGDSVATGVPADPSGKGKVPVMLHPQAWGYWVEMRGLALDPELPDLRIDYERREISFDWRRMLDEFFGEETYAIRRLGAQLERARENNEAKDALTDATESLSQTRIPEKEIACEGELIGDVLLNPRRDVEELDHDAYLAARQQRVKRWHRRQKRTRMSDVVPDSSSGNDISTNGVQRASEHERVLEMLRLREDLAKDVSICDDANEVRAVYRWNPEHDGISI